MKQKKNYAYDYDDEDEYNAKREGQQQKRRPIRNLVKAWESHSSDYEDIDDFYE